MSPTRRSNGNGTDPSPAPSQDDTEPMTAEQSAEAVAAPAAGGEPATADQAGQAEQAEPTPAADVSSEPTTAELPTADAPAGQAERMTAEAAAASAAGDEPATADQAEPTPPADSQGEPQASTEPGASEVSAALASARQGEPGLPVEASSEAAGGEEMGGEESAAVAQGEPTASTEPDVSDAGAASASVGQESEAGASEAAGAGDEPAGGAGAGAGGGEEGPSADESLSGELAAGRVQQPPQQRRSRQRGVRAALATLPVPEPGPSFWADLEAALEEQQPFAIAARPAIRPITEPPPLSQPKLSDYLESTNVGGERVRRSRDDSPGSDLARPPTRAPDFGLGGSGGRGRKVLAVIVVIVLGLLIAGTIMGDGDDEPSTATGEGAADDATTTTAPPPDAAPTTPPAVPGLETEARLTATGIGPVQVGMTFGEITAAGVTINVDQPTFDASGGACFDGRPAGAADLTLRFHGPEPGVGVADPAQGVLGAVSIRDVDGSLRATEAEIGLGATEELVRDAAGASAGGSALEVSDNPSRPGGHVYLARSAGNPDLGIAYATDGRQVTEISVGEVELIGVNQACA